MKKIKTLILVLAAMLVLVLAGCGGSGSDSSESVSSGSSGSSNAVSEVSFNLVEEAELEESAAEVDEIQQAEEAAEGSDEAAGTELDTENADTDSKNEDAGSDNTDAESTDSEKTSAADEKDADAADTNANTAEITDEDTSNGGEEEPALLESDTPWEKDEVAAYLHTYGHLPDNFITKNEAKNLGWVSKEGNLWDVAPGCSIGGDYFGNYEGKLPEAPGREYHECDVNYEGGYRSDERIIYSNDGLIYYTGDHYETFELLYGEEE